MGAADDAAAAIVKSLTEFGSVSTRMQILADVWKLIVADVAPFEHVGALTLVAVRTLPTARQNALATSVAYRAAVAKALEEARIAGDLDGEMARQRQRVSQLEELIACGGDPPAPKLETPEDFRRELERVMNPKKGQH